MCFSWGYSLPDAATTTVRCDLLREKVSEKGLHPENTFYAAETGVAEEETEETEETGTEVQEEE